MVLEQYRWVHPYMYERKLTDEVIELFDVGYDPETDMVTFPVRNIYGDCLFVARRSVKGKYFHYPSGAEKPLYGVYEISNLPYWAKEIWVTESMFNCLTLWTHGVPSVALNGTGSKYQLEELSKLNCRSLVIALDPDAAGRGGTQKIRNFLKDSHKILYTVQYKDNRDINDLSYEECKQLINSKILL
jgi:DNA primase